MKNVISGTHTVVAVANEDRKAFLACLAVSAWLLADPVEGQADPDETISFAEAERLVVGNDVRMVLHKDRIALVDIETIPLSGGLQIFIRAYSGNEVKLLRLARAAMEHLVRARETGAYASASDPTGSLRERRVA